MFNDFKVQLATSQKYLGLILDSRLDFNGHIDNKINKCNKIIGIMRRLSLILSRNTLYKAFVRSYLDYIDIIYVKPFHESFKRKIGMVQYEAALVITGAIKGISRDITYQELGSESVADGRWSRRLFSSTKLYRDSYHLMFKLTIMLLVKLRI